MFTYVVKELTFLTKVSNISAQWGRIRQKHPLVCSSVTCSVIYTAADGKSVHLKSSRKIKNVLVHFVEVKSSVLKCTDFDHISKTICSSELTVTRKNLKKTQLLLLIRTRQMTAF